MATLTMVKLEYAIVNTNAYGVQKAMKGSATVEELVVSKVARVGIQNLSK